MKTDPTETGGLFVGRRPGTAPVKYRKPPDRGSSSRRRVDTLLAAWLAGLMGLVNLLFWGPIPLGGLWVGSQASYQTGNNLFLGISVAFVVTLAGFFVGLIILKQLDGVWILIRRAAGHDQRKGIIGPMFAVCAVIGASLFTFWLLILGGLAQSIVPNGG
ncbi:MAG TPA: hypothetical protein VIL64_04825 [Solirubrobacteraceae bacterium]